MPTAATNNLSVWEHTGFNNNDGLLMQEHERSLRFHQRRLQKTAINHSTINNSTPRRFPLPPPPRNEQQMFEAKEFARKNKILLQRLTRLANDKSHFKKEMDLTKTLDNRKRFRRNQKLSTYSHKKAKKRSIDKENRNLLNRLIKIKPTIQNKKFKKDFNRHAKILDNHVKMRQQRMKVRSCHELPSLQSDNFYVLQDDDVPFFPQSKMSAFAQNKHKRMKRHRQYQLQQHRLDSEQRAKYKNFEKQRRRNSHVHSSRHRLSHLSSTESYNSSVNRNKNKIDIHQEYSHTISNANARKRKQYANQNKTNKDGHDSDADYMAIDDILGSINYYTMGYAHYDRENLQTPQTIHYQTDSSANPNNANSSLTAAVPVGNKSSLATIDEKASQNQNTNNNKQNNTENVKQQTMSPETSVATATTNQSQLFEKLMDNVDTRSQTMDNYSNSSFVIETSPKQALNLNNSATVTIASIISKRKRSDDSNNDNRKNSKSSKNKNLSFEFDNSENDILSNDHSMLIDTLNHSQNNPQKLQLSASLTNIHNEIDQLAAKTYATVPFGKRKRSHSTNDTSINHVTILHHQMSSPLSMASKNNIFGSGMTNQVIVSSEEICSDWEGNDEWNQKESVVKYKQHIKRQTSQKVVKV